MKSNIADKIKLFENAKIQHTAPLEFNPADSSQTKEEIIKLAPPPISKPRRKKKLTQTKQAEQAEYVNVSPAAEAQWYQASLSVSSSDYPQLADINLCPFDLEQSEYANLFPLGTSDTERFYLDPAEQCVAIPKKHTKKPSKESTAKETPIAGEIDYAELDLTQSDQVNALQGEKLDNTNTEYSYFGVDNKLIFSSKADQDKVLSIANNAQKTRLLGVERVAAVGAKNRNKDDYLTSLTAKFEKFKIPAIQEESTLASSMETKQKESVASQYEFSFFARKPEKLTQETKRSASNFSVMQNK